VCCRGDGIIPYLFLVKGGVKNSVASAEQQKQKIEIFIHILKTYFFLENEKNGKGRGL
jgi:hypothetical protein